jgi:hypothetical protein
MLQRERISSGVRWALLAGHCFSLLILSGCGILQPSDPPEPFIFYVPAEMSLYSAFNDIAADTTNTDFIINITSATTSTTIDTSGSSFANKTISITDNGITSQTITLYGTGNLFIIGSGVTFNLQGTGSGRTMTLSGTGTAAPNDSSLIKIYSGGILNLYDNAIITNNTSIYGGPGGVMVSGGAFNMYGGIIEGNNAVSGTKSYGGGVGVYDMGTFNMSGGEISGNTVTSNGSSAAGGGGVIATYGGKFYLSGGNIYGNKVESTSTTVSGKINGGGVLVSLHSSLFTMSGGSIYGNTLSCANKNVDKFYVSGAGVSIDNSFWSDGVELIKFNKSGSSGTIAGSGSVSPNQIIIDGTVQISGWGSAASVVSSDSSEIPIGVPKARDMEAGDGTPLYAKYTGSGTPPWTFVSTDPPISDNW